MTWKRKSLPEIKSSGKVSDNVILDDGSWVEEGSEVISSDPSKVVNLINTIVKGNSILFIDCVFEDGVSVEIKVNPDSIVEVNGLKMREKSNLKVRKALDKLQINNICLDLRSTLNLNPRNETETEASFTNCWVLNGSTWTILEPLTYKNRQIDGDIVSAPEEGGFRII